MASQMNFRIPLKLADADSSSPNRIVRRALSHHPPSRPGHGIVKALRTQGHGDLALKAHSLCLWFFERLQFRRCRSVRLHDGDAMRLADRSTSMRSAGIPVDGFYRLVGQW